MQWPEQRPTFAILERDGVQLGFDEPGPERPGTTIGGAELSITVDDGVVMAMHAALPGRVALEWGPEVYSYGRRELAFRDPDGYLVILSEPTVDPPTTAEPGD